MDAIHSLLQTARLARQNAYAPYSGYLVGAAVLTASGAVFAGANVENAAYPIGTCAEAGAIAAMVAAGERQIAEILVLAAGDALATPCGACRQRIREFGAADTKVHVAGPDGWRASFTLPSLLPEAFGPANLPEKRETGAEAS